jgi:hypothetical protein
MASSIGKYSGMDTATTKKLLAMIGPPALGMIASQWKQEGGGLSSLTNLLTGQQKNIAAALPSGFSLANIPGLPSAEGTLRVARESVGRTKEAVKEAARDAKDATSSAFNWLAPLAALLLLGLAAWYFFGRNIPGQNAVQKAATATAKTANDAANRAADRLTALKPVLPDLPDISAATKDLSGIFTSTKQTLGKIRDAASAEAALPQLKELNSKIDGIRNMLDKMPEASQATLGKVISKEFAPLQEQAAEIAAMPDVNDQVKKALKDITSKLAGMNLAQVSQDTTDILANLTKAVTDIKDAASAKEAVPQLREISEKIDGLNHVQSSMSPGGASWMKPS